MTILRYHLINKYPVKDGKFLSFRTVELPPPWYSTQNLVLRLSEKRQTFSFNYDIKKIDIFTDYGKNLHNTSMGTRKNTFIF